MASYCLELSGKVRFDSMAGKEVGPRREGLEDCYPSGNAMEFRCIESLSAAAVQ